MKRKLLGLLAVVLVIVACGKDSESTSVEYTLSLTARNQLDEWVGQFEVYFVESAEKVIEQDVGEYELYVWILEHDSRAFVIPDDLPSQVAIDAGLTVLASYEGKQDTVYLLEDGSITTRQLVVDSLVVSLSTFGITFVTPILVPAVAIELADGCDPAMGICTQYANPQANYSTTNYTEGAGDTDADWFDELDEGINGGSPDGLTTYWTSGSNPSSECITVDFAGVGLVTPGGGNKFQQVYHQKDNNKQIDVSIRLREGGTSIQGPNTYSDSPNRDSWSTRNDLIVTGVGDWDNLQTEVCVSVVGGGPGTEYHVSTFELEIPDAAGARRYSTVTQEN